MLGGLTGTSGSSRVGQRLPLMQLLPAAHQGVTVRPVLSAFSRYGLKSRLPSVPSRLELLERSLRFSHLCGVGSVSVTSAVPHM